ncbi:MAG: sugar phosphate isomerase/epimerase family protein [Thermodesulfobacteriota bacterium]
MPLLLHAWSLRRELLAQKLRPADLPGLAATEGFDGVEWLDRLLPSYERADWQALGRASAAAGLGPGALSISLRLDAPATLVAEQLDRAKRMLGQCADLRVATARVSLGGGPRPGRSRILGRLESLRPAADRAARPLGGLVRLAHLLKARLDRGGPPSVGPLPARAEPLALQRAAWVLQPLARQARDLGLTLNVENHWGLTTHPEDLLSLIELVWQTGLEARDGLGAPLGVCLDTGNWHPEIDPAAAAGLLAAKVSQVHFKLFSPDAGGLPRGLDGQLAALKAAGYAGGFSLEYEGPGDGLAGARAGVTLFRQAWA